MDAIMVLGAYHVTHMCLEFLTKILCGVSVGCHRLLAVGERSTGENGIGPTTPEDLQLRIRSVATPVLLTMPAKEDTRL